MNKDVQQQKPILRLDFPAVREYLSGLDLELSLYIRQQEQLEGLAPSGAFCKHMCKSSGHCQRFLIGLAQQKLENSMLCCGSCLPGAFTVLAKANIATEDDAVVMGCFVSKSLEASEELMRVAGRLELDHKALVQAAERQASYQSGNAEVLFKVLANAVEQASVKNDRQSAEVESLSRNLAETYEELSFVYKINNAMNVTANPQEYFQQIAKDLRELLAVKTVLVAIFSEETEQGQMVESIVHLGPLPGNEQEIVERYHPRLLAGSGCLIHGDPTHCPTYRAEDKQWGRMLLAPILRAQKQLGMILASEPRDGRDFDNIDATRLSSVANSAAVFLENFRLYGSMRKLFLGSMRALTSSIDAKDPYTCGHSERVGLISKRLLEVMGKGTFEAERIYLCGLLHDMGKIGVPEAVLRKPGKLTDYEFELIKRHPVIGAKIISGISQMKDLMPAVLHHHERMDGRGYPDALSREEIPFQARVLGVADALDAMTSDRPYRKALPARLAEAEIFRGSGTQFDPELVEVVLKLNFPRYSNELRNHKGGYLSEDIYQPLKPTSV